MGMKNKVGVLYDIVSGNTGDVAAGLSVKRILRKLKVDFYELIPGNFNPNDYDTVIIGGGYLLRPSPDFYYDKFKISGKHILNTIGVVGRPQNLHYLNYYKYVTVRSSGDRNKILYLRKDIDVVPCTSMLLEDIYDIPVKPTKPSLGIHLLPNLFDKGEESLFIKWLSTLPFTIYFLPITHHNLDFIYLEKLSQMVKSSVLLPIMTPSEILTFIGKLDYFISCSLHGAIFSYIHNVPFILYEEEKMRFFLEDRGLDKYLFANFQQMRSVFEYILNKPPDYSYKLEKDKKILTEHINRLKDILPISTNISFSGEEELKKDTFNDVIMQKNYQIHYQQMQMANLSAQTCIGNNTENLLQDVIHTIKKVIRILRVRGWSVLLWKIRKKMVQ